MRLFRNIRRVNFEKGSYFFLLRHLGKIFYLDSFSIHLFFSFSKLSAYYVQALCSALGAWRLLPSACAQSGSSWQSYVHSNSSEEQQNP